MLSVYRLLSWSQEIISEEKKRHNDNSPACARNPQSHFDRDWLKAELDGVRTGGEFDSAEHEVGAEDGGGRAVHGGDPAGVISVSEEEIAGAGGGEADEFRSVGGNGCG